MLAVVATLCGALATAPSWATLVNERLAPHELELHTFAESGRGLRTRRDRAAGEVLLSVDDSAVVTAGRLLKSESLLTAIAQHAAQGGGPKLTHEQTLCLFLLSRRLEGSAGDWVEYVSALPTSQPGPLGFSDEAALLPRCYERVVDVAVQHARTQCQRCTAAVRSARDDADVGPGLLATLSELADVLSSEEAYLWAYATVRARSIEVGTSVDGADSPLLETPEGGSVRALFPVLDMLNHQPTALTTLYKRSSGVWEIVSRDTYAAGEQVYVTYGARDNLKLLMTYGFALRDVSVQAGARTMAVQRVN